MAQTLSHRISVRIADGLNRYSPKEGIEYKKLVLGAEIIFINVSKLIVVFTASILLGVIVPTLLTLIGFNAIRRTAFGVHALTSIGCTVTSLIMFVVVPWFLVDFRFPLIALILIFACTLLSVFLFAPADTEARPIIGEAKRKAFKKQSLIRVSILLVILLVVPFELVKTMVVLGAMYETIFILPITYTVLGRRRNNYERYE